MDVIDIIVGNNPPELSYKKITYEDDVSINFKGDDSSRTTYTVRELRDMDDDKFNEVREFTYEQVSMYQGDNSFPVVLSQALIDHIERLALDRRIQRIEKTLGLD